jgi:hypothetical protein
VSGPGGAAKEPPNAFSSEFLDRSEHLAETDATAEADYAGPWKVEPAPGGYGLFRCWEDPAAGARPQAVCRLHDHALVLAAVLPSVGRELFALGDEAEAGGYPLRGIYGDEGVVPLAWLRHFDTQLAEAFHVGICLARSPVGLAALLRAAGPLALRRVGEILAGEVP